MDRCKAGRGGGVVASKAEYSELQSSSMRDEKSSVYEPAEDGS
jgi:hypothetical protein